MGSEWTTRLASAGVVAALGVFAVAACSDGITGVEPGVADLTAQASHGLPHRDGKKAHGPGDRDGDGLFCLMLRTAPPGGKAARVIRVAIDDRDGACPPGWTVFDKG